MKNLNITLKVIIYVSILGFSCIFAMGYVSINAADKILSKNAHGHLMSVQSMKKQQVEDFIQGKINAVEALAKMPITIIGVNSLINYSKNEGIQNKDFPSDVNIYSNSFLSYMNANNMDNIIIAESKNGKIIYSAMSERGFETDLSQQSNMISKV